MRAITFARPDRERFYFQVDWRRLERPVAADLDGVAVAGALHRVGQRGELALERALGAQEREGGIGFRQLPKARNPVHTSGEGATAVRRKSHAVGFTGMRKGI